MQYNIKQLQSILLSLKPKVAEDSAAVELIEHGVDLDKVIFELKQDLNNYSLSHSFKLPQVLTKLQLMLDENPDKWRDAGLTGSI